MFGQSVSHAEILSHCFPDDMRLYFEVCRLFDHLLDLFSFVDRRVGAEELRHHVFDGSKLLFPEILFLDLLLEPFWFLLGIADQGAD